MLLHSASRAEFVGLLIATVLTLTLRCCRYSRPARWETIETTPLNPILQAVSEVACPQQTKLSGSTLKRVNRIICEPIRCPCCLMLSLLLDSELVNICRKHEHTIHFITSFTNVSALSDAPPSLFTNFFQLTAFCTANHIVIHCKCALNAEGSAWLL